MIDCVDCVDYGYLHVRDAAVRDDEYDGVLDLGAGPGRVTGRVLQHLAVAGRLAQQHWSRCHQHSLVTLGYVGTIVQGRLVTLQQSLDTAAVGISRIVIQRMTVPHNATQLRTETEAKNFLIYKQKSHHAFIFYANRPMVDF